MLRINNQAQLSAMLRTQFKPGLLTNTALSADTFSEDLEAGTLWGHEIDNGLLLLRRRDGFDRLHYFLQSDAAVLFSSEHTTVLEIPCGPKNAGNTDMISLWEKAGFEQAFRRLHLVCSSPHSTDLTPDNYAFRTAEAPDLIPIMDLLYSVYDPLTACLPSKKGLSADIANGNIILAETGREIAGILRMLPGKKKIEIRHLAVSESHRRKHLAWGLISYCSKLHPVRTYHLWVAENNAPARNLYNTFGFTADGWTSTVLIKKGSDVT